MDIFLAGKSDDSIELWHLGILWLGSHLYLYWASGTLKVLEILLVISKNYLGLELYL